MKDNFFFKNSIKIFESFAYKKKLENQEIYTDDFWIAAAERIYKALNQNPNVISLMKLIYIDDKISENNLLNLLFSTICKTQRLFNRITQKPDEWGKSLIWPFYESNLVKIENLASPNAIENMAKYLNIEELAKVFNEMQKDVTFKEFPKTHKRIKGYFENQIKVD